MATPHVNQESGPQTEKISVLKSVALKFVEAINAGDPERLITLQTEDFTFTDMSGNVEHCHQGWHDYFSDFPEYKIHVKNIFTGGNGVAIIGRTTGSHVLPEIEKKETVLWTAEIQNGLVSQWRIYTDTDEARN